MEVSSTFHRCVRQMVSRSGNCRHLAATTNIISKQTRQSITRISSRTLTSTSQIQQDTPPQPIPVSNQKSPADTVGASPSESQNRFQPDPKQRIDLSSLPNIPSNYKPPSRRTVPNPGGATEKLNQLFKEKEDTRFKRTIYQTDRTNTSTQPDHRVRGFLDDLFVPEPSNPSSSAPRKDDKLALRLRPTLGRTVPVDHQRGIDLTKAFRMLEFRNGSNSVRSDLIAQKFHVRRGQKRKLDRSLRWRKAFKAGFLEECARIRRMKNQGW